MDNKHNTMIFNKNKFFQLFLILSVMFIIPFSSSVSNDTSIDLVDKVKFDKIKFDDKNYKLVDNKNHYESDFVKIISSSSNTINLDKAKFKKNYVSIPEYENNDNTPYEIIFYTGNHGVKYEVLKTDLTDITPEKVQDVGVKYTEVFSDSGYVTVKTLGFSTLFLSIPDYEVPFWNLVSLDLRQYFGDNVDHYEVVYKDIFTGDYLKLTEGFSSLQTDVFEVNLYDVGGLKYMDLYAYQRVCNDNIVDKNADCFTHATDTSGIGTDISHTDPNLIYVFGCQTGESTVVTTTTISGDCSQSDTFYLNTPENYRYFALDRDGLHDKMVEHYDFNDAPYIFSKDNGQFIEDNFVNSGSTYLEDGNSLIEQYVSFNSLGTNKISYPSYTLTSSTTSPFSINYWINGDARINNAYSFFVGDNNLNLHIYGKDGDKIRYRLYGTTGLVDNDYSWTYSTGWHMITLTYDGNIKKCYFDGVEVCSETIGALTSASDNGMSFGNYYTGSFSSGVYQDELTTFDEKITTDDIDFLFNNGFARRFHTLNTPADVILSTNQILQDGLTLTPSIQKLYLGNFCNWNDDMIYSFEYYDYIADNFVTITNGLETPDNSGFQKLKLLNGILEINSYDSPDVKSYEGNIKCELNGDVELVPIGITIPQIAVNNVTQLIPLNAVYDVTTQNVSINLNTHYQYYDSIRVVFSDTDDLFNDSLTYNFNITHDFNDGVYTHNGNITLILDSNQVNENIILDIYGVDNRNFNDDITIYFINSISQESDFFTLTSFRDSTLIKSLIGNQTVAINNMVCVDDETYFYNASFVKIEYTYLNESFNLNYTLNPDLVGPPQAKTNDHTDFTVYLTELGTLCFTAKDTLINQSFNFYVEDNLTNSDNQNFYINVVSSLPMTQGAEYFSDLSSLLVGFFPSASDLTSAQSIAIVLVVVFISSFLIIFTTYKRLGNTSIYLSIGVGILLFLFFAGIGYISTGFLVLIGLLLIGLSYLKMRGN